MLTEKEIKDGLNEAENLLNSAVYEAESYWSGYVQALKFVLELEDK